LRGLAGETAAALVLTAKGYRILERRFRTRRGEIDLIARRGRLIVFVEVKARPTINQALEAVTERQRRRLVAAATAWMAVAPAIEGCDFRFDVVAIAANALPHHLEGAFTADGF
jgi:putative endonuclease